MRRLLMTMVRLYFFARVSHWLFGTGILLAVGSRFMTPSPAKGALFLALILIAGLPLIPVTLLYSRIVSNRHFSLIPYGRQFVLGATCCLTLALSLLLSWGATLMDKPNQPGFMGVFLAVFCSGSLATVLANGVIGRRFVPFVLWIVMMLILDLFHSLWNQLPRIDAPITHIALALISLLSWSWLVLRLRQTSAVETKGFVSSPENIGYNWLENLVGQSSESNQLSGFLTLIQGFPLSQSSLFWKAAVPFLVMLVVGVFFLWFVPNFTIWTEALLAIPFVTIVILSFASGEWLARLRLLWLKIPGDRPQFWHLWKNLLHTELLLLVLILSLYSVAIKLLFEVSNVILALYAVITFLLLPSMCYSAAWFRLKGEFKNSLAVCIGIIYLLMVVFLILATYVNATYPTIVGLGLLSSGIYLLTYFQVKKEFLSLDWLKVRPTVQPQLGFGRH